MFNLSKSRRHVACYYQIINAKILKINFNKLLDNDMNMITSIRIKKLTSMVFVPLKKSLHLLKDRFNCQLLEKKF